MQKNMIESFQRDIIHKIFINDVNQIILTGTLKDIVHDIFIEFTIDQELLEIENVIVKFKQSPTVHCYEIEERVKLFIGLKIKTGLTRSILKILGTKEGCGNLLTLVMGLLPLAINAKAGAGLGKNYEVMDAIKQKLTGTCVGYPELK